MSITKLFHHSKTHTVMSTKRPQGAGKYLLLLIFFLAGAGLDLFCTEQTELWIGRLPVKADTRISVLLALDALLTGSLLAWCTVPFVTLALGAVCVEMGSTVLADGVSHAWPRLLLLALVLPLHFLVCAWSLDVASGVRALLRKRSAHVLGVCFVLMLCVLTLCALLVSGKLGALA